MKYPYEKNVFFVFPSLKRGGGNRILLSLQDKFINEGYKVTIYYLKTDHNLFPINKNLKQHFIYSKKNGLGRVYDIFKLCLQVARNREQNLIIFSDPIISIFSILFFKAKTVRYVQGNDRDLFDQNAESNSFINFIYKILFNISKKFKYHKIIFNSEYSRESYTGSSNNHKYPIIYPFVFNSPRKNPKEIPRKKIVSVLSNQPRKGLDKLKRIINSGLFENFEFSIISQDEFQDDKIKGYQPKNDHEYLEQMRENSFYFNFSDFEGFGLPPLEAMSLGLVIFTFPNEGIKSYCNKKNSFFSRFDDYSKLKLDLDSLISNPDLYRNFSLNSLKTAELFSEERFKNKFFKSINEI
tara:strand:- start:360 stop:1418 length:1059 start_codon:yes stop_codon:yes gene_type:complete